MRLEDYKTVACLIPSDQAPGWSESDVPLERRGVSLDWLVAFVGNLQNESQAPRALALQEAERAYHHNKAADYGMHD
jgi:hypothetical protein